MAQGYLADNRRAAHGPCPQQHPAGHHEIRWKRNAGIYMDVLWQAPGTDHAGIATQGRGRQATRQRRAVDARTGSREVPREGLGVEGTSTAAPSPSSAAQAGFILRLEPRALHHGPGLSAAVRENFVKLYEAGLIYSGTRMVNWVPVLQTALSDDEVRGDRRARATCGSCATP